MHKILDKSYDLEKLIESERKALINNLLEYESYETALDEIERSLESLQNIEKEIQYLEKTAVDSISTFFPLNLPLYSLILFAVIPSFLASNVYLRPPLYMRKILKEIYEKLDIKRQFPIHLIELERGIFVSGYVSYSDVVIFTGKYVNALKVKQSCPHSLFIYNGAGINPILVAENADIKLAVEKSIQARIFNSGQDCAGPDSILVPKKIKDEFLDELIRQMNQINVGDYKIRENRIGRITNMAQLDNIEKILRAYSDQIIYGGNVDFKTSTVHPTIILTNLKEDKNYEEFFSPIFFVSIYENEDELDMFFENHEFTNYSMYVSVFGDCEYTQRIKNSTILINQNILDVEKGNEAYGGYGPKANFVQYGNKYFHSRPVLISKEIYLWQEANPA
jgi:acyl-CoA reductase-like NAD-dependent aldehyde dehydrogenase